MKFIGTFYARIVNLDGSVADAWAVDNLITEYGCAHAASRLIGTSQSVMTHLAVGTGTGETAASTTLNAEIARVALASMAVGTGALDDEVGRVCLDNEVIYKASFVDATGAGTIAEFAVFDANAVGNMLNYATGFSKVKTATQTLVVAYVLTCGNS